MKCLNSHYILFQIRLILSDANSRIQPFVARSLGLLGSYEVCDNQMHTVTFFVGARGVEFIVDGQGQTFNYLTSFQFSRLTNQPLYLGGFPGMLIY